MPSELALPWLYRTVSAALAADGTPVQNLFGWRIPAQHPTGNRIAWVPGDPTGTLGLVTAPRNPGGNPRTLGTLTELFTCIIFGQDPADPENELLQYSIVRYLRDAWYRAVYNAAHGSFQVRAEKWEIAKLERRYGAALSVLCEIQATIPDEPFPATDPPAVIEIPNPDLHPVEAELTVSELDVDEVIHVSGDDPI